MSAPVEIEPFWKPPQLEAGRSAWQPKAWGHFRTLFCDAQVEIVECSIVAGGFSSIHKHLDKDNAFIVLAGELEVTLYPSSMRPTKYVLLPKVVPGEVGDLIVPPCIPHRFVALQETRLIEIYRAQHGKPLRAGEGDICRDSAGGVRPKQ